jgi:hypothetical protein
VTPSDSPEAVSGFRIGSTAAAPSAVFSPFIKSDDAWVAAVKPALLTVEIKSLELAAVLFFLAAAFLII